MLWFEVWTNPWESLLSSDSVSYGGSGCTNVSNQSWNAVVKSLACFSSSIINTCSPTWVRVNGVKWSCIWCFLTSSSGIHESKSLSILSPNSQSICCAYKSFHMHDFISAFRASSTFWYYSVVPGSLLSIKHPQARAAPLAWYFKGKQWHACYKNFHLKKL